MKATIVLVAGTAAENYGRQLMLDAHRAGGMGFEMARLPQHVSLKQPFAVPGFNEIADFFDGFARGIPAQRIRMEKLEISPNDVLGGVPSGCLSIKVEQSEELRTLQRRLFGELEARFGPCPAMHDDDYVFHMTVAIGGAPYENYERAYEALSKRELGEELLFDKAGLFWYDDDAIRPGTYFCCRLAELEK